MDIKLTLKDLGLGDIFYHASDKKKSPKLFQVRGPNEYSAFHGSPVRRCVDISARIFCNKSSRLQVVKVKK